MSFANLDLDQLYTYADYLKWNFEERLELIRGKIFPMAPAPTPTHQRISANLEVPLFQHLKGKTCEVFHAPFDVRFPKLSTSNEDIVTVLQPDICVICDPAKIDDKGCLGAPDIVVEILSPSNSKKEMKTKYDIYEEHGVKEYWVVFPTERIVLMYQLHNGSYVASKPKTEGDMIVSELLPGFSLGVAELFRVG